MDDISAIITSKGQITLPKTVREVMGLDTGDKVNFSIESNGEVIMKKGDLEAKAEATSNLIPLLLENGVITVSGSPGTGKKYFVMALLKNNFSSKKVAFVASYSGDFDKFIEHMDNVLTLKPEELDVQSILKKNVDVIVVYDYTFNDSNVIKELREAGIKIIIIKQKFSEEELMQCGDHFSISTNRLKPLNVGKIERIIKKDTGFERSTVYIS